MEAISSSANSVRQLPLAYYGMLTITDMRGDRDGITGDSNYDAGASAVS